MATLGLVRLSRLWGAATAEWPGGCPPAWPAVRGPIGGAARELARVGWRFVSAGVLGDPSGNLVRLNRVAPKDLLPMLVDAQTAVWERAVSVRAGTEPVSLQPLAALARTRRHAQGRSLVLAWGAGGLTTDAERKTMGYDVTGRCALCGEVDDARHRWGRCGHPTVSTVMMDPRVRRVCESWDPDSALDARGWVKVGDLRGTTKLATRRCVDWWGQTVHGKKLEGGLLFTDGSGFPCAVRAGARAGWAVVRWSDRPGERLAFYGNVPAPYPQTNMVGEYWAWAAGQSGRTAVGWVGI